MEYWSNLSTDAGAHFDKEFFFDGTQIEPMITFGTNPGMGIGIQKNIPQPTASQGKATYENPSTIWAFQKEMH